MLKVIKLAHTVVWAIMVSAILYVLYSGITKTSGPLLWISMVLVLLEFIVLIINRWVCPLTILAMNYTTERHPSFDIYLPRWLAKHNKTIFGTIAVIGFILVIYNSLI